MMSMEELTEVIRPLAGVLAGVALDDADAARQTIERQAPFESELVNEIRKAAEAGAEAGWLLPKEAGGVRFGRVAKDLDGFSVDAVLMSSPGPRHRHPNGEIDLCFTTSGDARFDGHGEGWVVYGPDSTHVPTVSDGEMLILYFLPGAAIEFLG